jgi:hypothetical protein
MHGLVKTAAAAAIFVYLGSPASAQADDIWRAGARVHVVASGHQNVRAAGALVTVRGDVANELWVAGAEVDVDATTKGNTWVAGAVVAVKGATDKDLSVAGARVSVDARVGGELSVAGARVLVGPQTEVRGRMRLAGAEVVFSGIANGPARIAGDTVQIDGHITGDLRVRARSVSIGSRAVIDGDVVFETLGEPEIAEGAKVRGRQTVTLPRPRPRDGWTVLQALAGVALFGIGAGFVLGLVLLIVARPFVERSIAYMRVTPAWSLLVGLAVLILFPLLAILLLVTVIGIPVGILALLAFPLLLFTGSVIAAFGLSDWIFNRAGATRSFGGRLLLLLGGLLVLVLVGLVPLVGFVTWLVAVMFGLGAVWRALRGPSVPVAAPA